MMRRVQLKFRPRGPVLRQMAAILLVLVPAAVLMTPKPAFGLQTTLLASSFEGALGAGFSLINSAGTNVTTGVQRATVAFSTTAARSGTLGLVVNISSVSNTSYDWNVLLSVSSILLHAAHAVHASCGPNTCCITACA